MTRKLRIRRCNGNRTAWCLVALRPDGTEIESYGAYLTSYSINALVTHAAHLTPQPGEVVELIA